MSKAALPTTLDDDILSGIPHSQGRSVNAVKGFALAGAKSHVLLAACRETESAFENDKRGYFTHELLRALRGVKPNMVTYKDLMQRISNNISGYVVSLYSRAADTIDVSYLARPHNAKAITRIAYCSMRASQAGGARCMK